MKKKKLYLYILQGVNFFFKFQKNRLVFSLQTSCIFLSTYCLHSAQSSVKFLQRVCCKQWFREQLCILCSENPPCFLLLGNPIPAALEEMCGGGKWWDSEEEWLWPSNRWSKFCHAVRAPTARPLLFLLFPTPPTAPGPFETSHLWLISCSCSLASLQVHIQVSSGEGQGSKGTCLKKVQSQERLRGCGQISEVETCRFYFRLHIRVIKTLKIVPKTNSLCISILIYSFHSMPILHFSQKRSQVVGGIWRGIWSVLD